MRQMDLDPINTFNFNHCATTAAVIVTRGGAGVVDSCIDRNRRFKFSRVAGRCRDGQALRDLANGPRDGVRKFSQKSALDRKRAVDELRNGGVAEDRAPHAGVVGRVPLVQVDR